MGANNPPFEVGQLVETRSFIPGYRGAWFRCKIKEIRLRKNELWHGLEYSDYLDQKLTWTKVFQKVRHSKDGKRILMVRPSYPSVYHENEMPDLKDISNVVVTINNVWNLGDLVDWFTDGCFWSGRITQKLGDEKVKIELPTPPVGEGSSYEVFYKDLRPSLDWSINEGWKLCIAKESNYNICSAQIVKPLNQDHTVSTAEKDVQPTDGASMDHKGSVSLTSKQTNTIRKITGLNIVDPSPKRTSCSNSVSSRLVQDGTSEQMLSSSFQSDKYDNFGSSKKIKIELNSTSSDATEAAVLDLEELINRVKWLNNILNPGMPSSRTCWKFVEHRGPTEPT